MQLEGEFSGIRNLCMQRGSIAEAWTLNVRHIRAFFGIAKHHLSAYSRRDPTSSNSVQIEFDKPFKIGNSLSENEPIKLILVH